MKEMTMDKSKRKKLKARNKASYAQARTHSDKLSSYSAGGMPARKAQTDNDSWDNSADRAYRRLVHGDVYSGSSKKTPMSNKTKRRYK